MSTSFQQDMGTQGTVSIEAESYHSSVVAPDGHEWLPAGAGFPGFSGTDALQALPEDSVIYSDPGYSQLSPQLGYQVNFVATGTHYVWMRAWDPSLSSTSVHVGLDAQELATGENMNVPTAANYVWVSQLASGARATLNITIAGEHTVNVWARETGAIIDKIVLTTDSAYDPSIFNGSLGPDESIQTDLTDADLSVALTVDSIGPLEGATVIYTASVTNLGPAVATAVVLTDQLPTGLTYLSNDASNTGTSFDSSSGDWTVGTVLAGQTVSLNLTVSVDTNTIGSILTNTVSISGLNEIDLVPENDSVSILVAVVDLSVMQSVDNANPLENSTVVFTMTLLNQSLVLATGVALTDQLPAGLTYVSDDAGSTGTLYDNDTWTVGTMLAGQSISLNLTATVDTGTAGSILTNTVSVDELNETDPVPGNDIVSMSVVVANPNSVDLSISQTVDNPSQPSAAIMDIVFDMSTLKNDTPGNNVSASGSDNWPITWSGNNNQYTSFGDGQGFTTFNSTRASLGVARIEGNKDNYSAFDIFKTGETSGGWGGKSLGILAIGTDLYMFRNGTGSSAGAYEQTELYTSTDNGFSWNYTGVRWLPNESTGIDSFFSPTFLQFGKGYAGARDNYVYIYANEITTSVGPGRWNVQKPGKISLLRVNKTALGDKNAYEYFSGLDASNNPTWSADSSDRKPVFNDDTNGIMRTSVSYNAGLGRYLLTTQQVNRWQADNYHIGIYEAPEPWGPWSTILLKNPADIGSGLNNDTKTVYWNFSNKWLSDDGRNFVMVYTGPGRDQWGTVEGRFVTSGSTAIAPPKPPTKITIMKQ
ncbi:MAG: DUF11 domain-containing protein [Gammaproteobacteria bacterium]|nr:DUF11 domain-containing protein [Gammaproteobacteria bacterium]